MARYGSSALSGVEHLTLLVAEVRVCRSRDLETQAKPTRTVLNPTSAILPLSALFAPSRTLTSSYSTPLGICQDRFPDPSNDQILMTHMIGRALRGRKSGGAGLGERGRRLEMDEGDTLKIKPM